MSLPIVEKREIPNLDRWHFPLHNFMGEGQANVLVALIESVHPKVVYEFGVNVGWTARDILNIKSIERYVGVDVDDGYATEITAQQIEVPDNPGHLVKDDPRFELRRLPNGTYNLSGTDICDAVFIDGDHGRETVLYDSIIAAAMVRPGGIIVWHDVGNTTVQVTEVVEHLRACGRDIRLVEDTWMAFERR